VSKGLTARPVVAARIVAVGAEYQLKLLRLDPTTIPASSTGCHPTLAVAFLRFEGFGKKLLLCFCILPCAANQPILR
jgi:hypothetical protein